MTGQTISLRKAHSVRSQYPVDHGNDRAAATIHIFTSTLQCVKGRQNVTLSRFCAGSESTRPRAITPMTRLMSEAIRALLDQDEQSAKAKRRFLQRIRSAPDRGTNGRVRWTREELHER